jgi:hypothetical protein
VRISGSNPFDVQRVAVAADGSFLIKGLRSDSYQIVPELRGYSGSTATDVLVNRNVDGFRLMLSKESR